MTVNVVNKTSLYKIGISYLADNLQNTGYHLYHVYMGIIFVYSEHLMKHIHIFCWLSEKILDVTARDTCRSYSALPAELGEV